jgi:MarR family 2-MHQ and catechol resistance regulon transcriptional repressor
MAPMAERPAVKSSELERDAIALQDAVSELVRVYQFRDRDQICCYDVSVTQCHALEILVEHGPMRLGALTERLFLDKSTTSRVVGTLVKKGYVEQRADEADGRASALHATASGRRLCRRIIDDLVGQQKQLLRDLDPDVRETVIKVIRGLARAADSRFRSGVSTGSGGACCVPGSDGGSSCA